MRFASLTLPRLSVLFLLLGAGPATAGQPGQSGQLCFVRANDVGFPNPHPVRIFGEHDGVERKLVELRDKTKKKVCVSVPNGSWKLEARSAHPTDRKAAAPEACKSYPFLVEVKGPEPTISVSPLGGGPTNMCGWDFR
jgi:hypothetical protein